MLVREHRKVTSKSSQKIIARASSTRSFGAGHASVSPIGDTRHK